jgi:hypothetical protein
MMGIGIALFVEYTIPKRYKLIANLWSVPVTLPVDNERDLTPQIRLSSRDRKHYPGPYEFRFMRDDPES